MLSSTSPVKIGSPDSASDKTSKLFDFSNLHCHELDKWKVKAAHHHAPEGYRAVFDANGVATLKDRDGK